MNSINDKIRLIATNRDLMNEIFLYNLSKQQLIENIKSLFNFYSISFNVDNVNQYLQLIGNMYAINIWNYLELSDEYITIVDTNKIISCFKYFITLDLNINNNVNKIKLCVKAYNRYNSFDVKDIEKAHYLNRDEIIKILELMIKYELEIKKIELVNIIRFCSKFNELFQIFFNSKKDFIIYTNINNKKILMYTINIIFNKKRIQFKIINDKQLVDKKMIKKITKITRKIE
jgi:hypothetical protein